MDLEIRQRIGEEYQSVKLQLHAGEAVTISPNENGSLTITNTIENIPPNVEVTKPKFLYEHSAFKFNRILNLVTYKANKEHLTRTEAQLLEHFFQNLHMIMPIDSFIPILYPGKNPSNILLSVVKKNLKVYVSRLRHKIPESGNMNTHNVDDHFIANKYGEGYGMYDPKSADFNDAFLADSRLDER